MKPGPLAGLRVVTTRERDADHVLAGILRLVGARVIQCPAIRRERIAHPPGAAAVARGLKAFDWMVFTSAAAAREMAGFCRARRLSVRSLARTKVAAVGRETARAVRRFLGVRVAVVPEESSGEALAGSLGRIRGCRILVPRALVGRENLPRGLRARGAAVVILPLYRTVPDRRGLAELRRLVRAGRVDWAVFASPSAASAAMRALGPAGRLRFRAGVRAAAIGPVTARALKRWGVGAALVARETSMGGLARAIVRYHRKRHVEPAR